MFTAKPWRPRGLGGQRCPRVPAASAGSPLRFSKPPTPRTRLHSTLVEAHCGPRGGGDPGVRAPVLGERPEAGP